jgi:hypothetical protein
MKQFDSHFLYSHYTPQHWKVDTNTVPLCCEDSNWCMLKIKSFFFEFLTLSICTEFKLKTQAYTT